MWYIDRQPMGRTHPKDYRGHGPLSVMPDAANGHTAVVSNFNTEQSSLMLQLAVQGPGEDLSLEGTEVKCSCQPRGKSGPTRETKTVIGESGTCAVVHVTSGLASSRLCHRLHCIAKYQSLMAADYNSSLHPSTADKRVKE